MTSRRWDADARANRDHSGHDHGGHDHGGHDQGGHDHGGPGRDHADGPIPLGDAQAMLADLAEALGTVAPLLEQTRRLGAGAYAWHGIDTELELASLVYDSALEERMAVRGPATPTHRTVVFAAADASIQLSHGGDGGVGPLSP